MQEHPKNPVQPQAKYARWPVTAMGRRTVGYAFLSDRAMDEQLYDCLLYTSDAADE